ncbi:DUF6069 family protein [Nocardiopsis lambiniae]|uniref:DUF6069 family protein n=1 Tax=Nocardiopsis lambiniae TaxID=3075539 RepID=A0ABU2M8Q7_9ACTN|nr:DUF6069 family protein [Nocardiopsis sp. DSM 44743]MDT0329054.1 DUF6069 family protein [Nocardiopsis sp. DSM 44743]
MNEFTTERPVNAVRLWSGGLATAVVAALVILVGTLFVRGVLGIPVLAPEEAGYLGDAGTALYALVAAVAALAATALMHLLLVAAPRARAFFVWIIGLITAIAVVTPFTQGAEGASQVGTALINLVAGVAIAILVNSVARTAVVRGDHRGAEKPALRHEGILPDVDQAEFRGEPRGR